MADGLIAVTGATGAVGGAVAALLAERGIPQRLVVRDPSRAPTLPGVESVRQIADYGHADDVLLLRPAAPGSGLGPMPLPPVDAAEPDSGLVAVRVYSLELADRAPRGGLASFVTEPAENTFPGLPVRADASVYVTLDRSADPGPYDDRAEIARLVPTARSPLRG